jgi:hypothetical protein
LDEATDRAVTGDVIRWIKKRSRAQVKEKKATNELEMKDAKDKKKRH